MNLSAMTNDELRHWLTVLTDELCRRAAPPAPPQQPRAPWDGVVYSPPGASRAVHDRTVRDLAGSGLDVRPYPAEAPAENPIVAQLQALLAQAQAPQAAPRSFTSVTQPAPSMLGGQRRPPGVVLTTPKTDPDLAAKFAALPDRHDGQMGPQGNGRADGMIDIG